MSNQHVFTTCSYAGPLDESVIVELRDRWADEDGPFPGILKAIVSGNELPSKTPTITVQVDEKPLELLDLRGIDLSGHAFGGQDFSYVCFDYANFNRAYFDQTHLQSSSLNYASLESS